MTAKTMPYLQEDLALIPAHAKDFVFIRVLVLSSNYYRSELIDQHPEIKMEINITNEITAYTSPEHKQAWAHVKLALVSNPINTPFNDAMPFKIEAVIETRYEYKGNDLSDEMFTRVMNAFCHTAALTHSWSFFRQLVIDALGRMMLPPIMLPLLINQMNQHNAPQENAPTKRTSKRK